MLLLLPLYSLVPPGIADSCIFIILLMPSHSLSSHQVATHSFSCRSLFINSWMTTLILLHQNFQIHVKQCPKLRNYLRSWHLAPLATCREILDPRFESLFIPSLSHNLLRLDQHHTQVGQDPRSIKSYSQHRPFYGDGAFIA